MTPQIFNQQLFNAYHNQYIPYSVQYGIHPLTIINNIPAYPVVVAGPQNALDVCTLIANLPSLYQDQTDISSTLEALLTVVARQQAQISALEKKLEEVSHGNIVLKAQDNLSSTLIQLASAGYEILGPEIEVKFDATATNASHDRATTGYHHSLQSDSTTNISAQIGGIAKKLLSLRIPYKKEVNLSETINSILQQEHSSLTSKSQSGIMKYKFDSIKYSGSTKSNTPKSPVKNKNTGTNNDS